jgi:hypothetical protein
MKNYETEFKEIEQRIESALARKHIAQRMLESYVHAEGESDPKEKMRLKLARDSAEQDFVGVVRKNVQILKVFAEVDYLKRRLHNAVCRAEDSLGGDYHQLGNKGELHKIEKDYEQMLTRIRFYEGL